MADAEDQYPTISVGGLAVQLGLYRNPIKETEMDNSPQLGQRLPESERRRDAIHIAIAPVTAAVRLTPGQRVGLTGTGDPAAPDVAPTTENIGIVDPFLADIVRPGERVWLCLDPNTITGLRHVWSHPAFAALAASRREAPQ